MDKNAIAIVKDLQKLNGLDDDYDNDSGSGPHNVGRRKTIHNLEKARQKKRNIGTLDVAFKKRFFNMNANDGPGKIRKRSKLLSFCNRSKSKLNTVAVTHQMDRFLLGIKHRCLFLHP